jgi:hypothetical protein
VEEDGRTSLGEDFVNTFKKGEKEGRVEIGESKEQAGKLRLWEMSDKMIATMLDEVALKHVALPFEDSSLRNELVHVLGIVRRRFGVADAGGVYNRPAMHSTPAPIFGEGSPSVPGELL